MICDSDPAANVFVAARILEGAITTRPGSVLGLRVDGALESLCWASANVVPVATTEVSRPFFVERLRRWRSHCASLLGPRDEVTGLWTELAPTWGTARDERWSQPLLATRTPPSRLGVPLDERVRPARMSELDLVLPAAVDMFTNEIGYRPYIGNGGGYRSALAGLIQRGHTYVVVDDGEVIFKTDVGSVALGCAQLQGVWLTPRLRGQGLSVSMLATVVERVMADIAPLVSLYVNDYNLAARAAYARIGMTQVGEFSTILF